LPEDVKERNKLIIHRFSAVASTSHFMWPIPERGLAKRLRRVKADTLVIWGRQDALVPAVYADEFAARIAGARVRLVDGAGHVPQVEQQDEVSRAVLEFLA
jgi:pimeloyl-ACP methyl ester carboxylesterase